MVFHKNNSTREMLLRYSCFQRIDGLLVINVDQLTNEFRDILQKSGALTEIIAMLLHHTSCQKIVFKCQNETDVPLRDNCLVYFKGRIIKLEESKPYPFTCAAVCKNWTMHHDLKNKLLRGNNRFPVAQPFEKTHYIEKCPECNISDFLVFQPNIDADTIWYRKATISTLDKQNIKVLFCTEKADTLNVGDFVEITGLTMFTFVKSLKRVSHLSTFIVEVLHYLQPKNENYENEQQAYIYPHPCLNEIVEMVSPAIAGNYDTKLAYLLALGLRSK